MTPAHAKLNLGLTVLAREESGYHEIETVFCLIELADEVDITLVGSSVDLEVTGLDAGPERDNLVTRTAEAFFAQTGARPGARIRLNKRIPPGAGLGGGSSDAAATLRELNALHGHPLGAVDMRAIALDIGSDVPFFLSGSAFALAWGRGQRILPLPAPPRVNVLLVVPPTRVSTRAAYESLAKARAGKSAPARVRVLDVAALQSWSGIGSTATNDFEEVVFAEIPVLRHACAAMSAAGARVVGLTGSGSAVFGVFEGTDARDAAIEAVRELGAQLQLIETQTRTTAPAEC